MKHKFTSAHQAAIDTSLVDGPRWNQPHVIVGRAVATNFTCTADDDLILATGEDSGIACTPLPSAPDGTVFMVMKVDSGAGAVTILGTINGQTNFVLTDRWQYVELLAYSGTWLIVRGGVAQIADVVLKSPAGDQIIQDFNLILAGGAYEIPLAFDPATAVLSHAAAAPDTPAAAGNYVYKFAVSDATGTLWSRVATYAFTADNGTDFWEVDWNGPDESSLPAGALFHGWVSFNGGPFQHLALSGDHAFAFGMAFDASSVFDSLPVPSSLGLNIPLNNDYGILLPKSLTIENLTATGGIFTGHVIGIGSGNLELRSTSGTLVLQGTAATILRSPTLIFFNIGDTKFFGQNPDGGYINYNVGADSVSINFDPSRRVISAPKFAATALQSFANNAAAIGGGLLAGDFYRTGADPDVVCVVH